MSASKGSSSGTKIGWGRYDIVKVVGGSLIVFAGDEEGNVAVGTNWRGSGPRMANPATSFRTKSLPGRMCPDYMVDKLRRT